MTSPCLNCAGYERQGHSGHAWLNERKGTGAKAMAAPVLDIIQKRLELLAAHGYVEMRKGQWELTEKGLCCLIACAEPPMPEPMDAYKSSCSELSRATRSTSKFL